jgi:hypothetical protein
MSAFYRLLLLLGLTAFFTACQSSRLHIYAPPQGPTPWTSLAVDPPDDQFQFAIVTDRTGGLRPGVFSTAVDKLNLLRPQFVMSVGDLITGYTEDLPELNRQWDEFDALVDRLEMPFFYVPGNHDITNAVMDKLWRERLGATYYHFVYQDVLFLCLNSEDQYRGAGRGTISDEQYAYIEETLARHADVRWTLVFLHQPLWDQDDPQRWPDVEQLLREREHTVYAGHVHRYERSTRNNGRYYTLATTGGGSSLRGPKLGEFDHLTWVTMTNEGPIMANLALDGIYPEDVTTDADYDFIQSIFQSFPVRFSPIYATESSVAADTIQLQMHNPSDLPMTVTVEPRFSFDLQAELAFEEVVVAPNSVHEAVLVLRNRRAAAVPETAAVGVHFDLAFPHRSGELTLPLRYKLGPLRPNTIRSGTVQWQGKDWPFQFGHEDSEIAGDCEVQWDVVLEDDHLVIWAEVTDDAVVVRAGETGFRQDYLAVVVNADPLPVAMLRDGARWYENSFVFLASPAKGEVPATTFYTDRYDFPVDYECYTTDTGYRFRVRLPLDYLRGRQGTAWRHLRINVSVQDEDPEEEGKPRFHWQPDWRGDDNVVGSGLFWRE